MDVADFVVSDVQFQGQARVARGKTRDQRGDDMPPESGSRRDAQPPLQFAVAVADGPVCQLHIRNDALHFVVVKGSVLGQRHASGGALQQTRAQVCFQAVDGLADGGGTEAEIFRCACNRSGFNYFDKTVNRSKQIHVLILDGPYS